MPTEDEQIRKDVCFYSNEALAAMHESDRQMKIAVEAIGKVKELEAGLERQR